MPALPAQGSTAWYTHYTALDTAMRAVVNVKNYGATGNGSTDDIAAINAAIADLPAGGVLLFPPGTYIVTSTVLIRRIPGLTVRGEGATISLTATPAPTARVLSIESCVGVTVTGISLRHTNTGTRQTDADGLAIRRCSDFLVFGVKALSVYSVGIRVGGSIRGTVSSCQVRDTLADGIGVYGAVTDATGSITTGTSSLTSTDAYFTSADVGGFVQITGAGAAGATLTATITGYTAPNTVTLSAAASTTVSGAVIKVARHSEDVTIMGSHTYTTADDAISSVGYLTLGGIPAAPNRNITITGNTIRGSSARGILTAGQNLGAVADNVIDSCSAAGIFIHTESSAGGSFGSTDFEVHGNIVTNCNYNYPTSNYGSIAVGSGVDAYPTSSVTIRGNNIRGGGSYYIGVGSDSGTNTSLSTQDIIVDGNMCQGGNGANAGINIVKTADVTVTSNVVDKAYRSAISSDANITGVFLVSGNNITAADQGVGGYLPISVATGAIVDSNLIDGVMGGAPEYIAPPASMWPPTTTTALLAWWGVNGALLQRFTVARTTAVRYLNFYIGTSSGNIQVGIVKLSPTNVTAWTSLVASSGVIACPASGNQRIDLGAGITLVPGEYALFFWANNTTLTTSHDLGVNGMTASRMSMSGTYASGITGSGAASFTNRYIIGLTGESV